MSKDQIKHEINMVLDRLSDKSLEELLRVLKGNEKEAAISIFDPASIRAILSQDAELLQRLAK